MTAWPWLAELGRPSRSGRSPWESLFNPTEIGWKSASSGEERQRARSDGVYPGISTVGATRVLTGRKRCKFPVVASNKSEKVPAESVWVDAARAVGRSFSPVEKLNMDVLEAATVQLWAGIKGNSGVISVLHLDEGGLPFARWAREQR